MSMTEGYAGTTLTAFFDERDDADEAVERLVENNIPRDRITFVAGSSESGAEDDDDRGFFEKLKDFFFPDEDTYTYAEGLRRGGHLVTVRNLSRDEYDVAVDILDDEGAIDLDERTQMWRTEGWEGYRDADVAGTPGATSGAAMGGGTNMRATQNAETIPVVQEDLRVGKRDVNLGRVRVRSYIHEEPASNTVRLHDERVVVDRRPVDRAAAGDEAFRERTIEAEEHAEEAVVSKDARVVEEVRLRKEAEDHDETINDTVRHTEVEVDDQRNQAQRAARNSTRR